MSTMPVFDIIKPTCPPAQTDACILNKPCYLIFEDGSVCQGYSFGADDLVAGECVFQTGMIGYTESLTDPSYSGQILVLTYPIIGNYGVPSENEIHQPNEVTAGLKKFFESDKIYVSALVVGQYSESYSHYLASSSLSEWLIRCNVPAIYGVDTRAITKRIRNTGTKLAFITFTPNFDIAELVRQYSPRTNLVSFVSSSTIRHYESKPCPTGRPPVKITCVDMGIKFNQIRFFLQISGVKLTIVPSEFDFASAIDSFDGLFLSNGPGDPKDVIYTIKNLQALLEYNESIKNDTKKHMKPIFGICLGHQVLALAAGARTLKLKFGNRGYNIPCTDHTSENSTRCYITSQNHGYAVIPESLPMGWCPYFTNANDGSNEGIFHAEMPYFSVQFHPESAPGPHDTQFLFDKFVESVRLHAQGSNEDIGRKVCRPVVKSDRQKKTTAQPSQVKKVLVLGSGGLTIGQAGEFDYSGSQAIKALKEEGIYTILINPNIATIQTSKGLADKVYFLPVTPDYVRKIILYDRPDGIYVTFGGQTALNVAVQMRHEFEELGVKVLGTPIDAIMTTEDRDLFSRSLQELGEKCAASETACTIEEAIEAASVITYPVIVRAAYALGGLGSGFAENDEQLALLCSTAFASSPQVLIEKSMKGWKEIEYEVVRDAYDNCITVCNMENFDPLGIHTGDSIVISPSQTLSNDDHNMLRTTALKVIRHLGIIGECNIQYALDPFSTNYSIIEVNARLSRSSALASKATGYPLAFVAAKLGLGIPLNKIKNSVTKDTCACFEPSLDYCVVKIPRWDLNKFTHVSKHITSAMKSVGEVMSIGRSFEEAIQKAIRAVDFAFLGFCKNNLVSDIEEELKNPTDMRLFAIANALHNGYTIDKISELTNIDKWFLGKLHNIVKLEQHLQNYDLHSLSTDEMRYAKQLGFSDRQIATCLKSTEIAVRENRINLGITPFVKQIDTVAAEFPATTNYLYMTYNASEHDIKFDDHGIAVLGSGVYRIGSSVEFDWCAVRAVRTLRAKKIKTIMINYNPETVSTDYDEVDRLYFENITLERVLDIYEVEKSSGVILSMGGQTPNNIALPLLRQNVKILGTSPEMIDGAENRYKFSRMLDNIGIDQPLWKELTSLQDALLFCKKVGYPVLVRPSYVLSGAAMNTVFCEDDLEEYLSQATAVSIDTPVVISKFIEEAKEIEYDAVAHDGTVLQCVISEHIENAGVHSGDATLVLPPQDLSSGTMDKIRLASAKIANELNITGPFNIQFIAKNDEIKVIECNVRASRSFPFVSKATNIRLVELAVLAMLDLHGTYNNSGVSTFVDIWDQRRRDAVAVKVPQFSFSRLSGADPVLGVEMASTGEVACFGRDKYEAYLKALISTGFKLPRENILLSIGSYREKLEFLPSIKRLHELGFKIFATSGTADFIQQHEIPVKFLDPDTASGSSKKEYSLQNALTQNLIDLYINLPSHNKFRRPSYYISAGYRTRRMAVDLAIPLITNVKCAKTFVEAISRYGVADFSVKSHDYINSAKTLEFDGWVIVDPKIRNVEKCLAAGVVAIVDVDIIRHEDADNLELCTSLVRNTSGLVTTDAHGAALASIMFLCLLHERSLHVTQLRPQDFNLVVLAREQGHRVTCDVPIHHLSNPVFARKLCYIDAFTIAIGQEETALEQLFEAALSLCMSINDIAEKTHGALCRIFQVSVDATVEIEERTVGKCVYRLMIGNKTVYLDGKITDNDYNLERKSDMTKSGLFVDTSKVLTQLQIHKTTAATLPPNSCNADAGQGSQRQTTPGPGLMFTVTPQTQGHGQALAQITTQLQTQVQPQHGVYNSIEPSPVTTLTMPHETFIRTRVKSQIIALDMHSGQSSLSNAGRSVFYGQHILASSQFTRDSLHYLFALAQRMRIMVTRNEQRMVLAGKVMCTAFYEPSTRTCSSFTSAWQRLGGGVISIVPETSSIAKGESFADTVRAIASYADCIVLRHPEKGMANRAAKAAANVPVVNAGDGVGEHPTQALLDIFTIREELGTVNGVTVTVVGDLLHGRTVHSLLKLLCLYNMVRINCCSPPSLRLPYDVSEHVRKAGVEIVEGSVLGDFIPTTDVLYVTRVQKERFATVDEYDAVKNKYVVDSELMRKAKQNMIVMHPLPRINEISTDVDSDPRAVYFRQMKHGLYVRMALLTLVVGAEH